MIIAILTLLAVLGSAFYWIAQRLAGQLGVAGPGVFTIAQFLVALVTLGPILWAVFRYRSLADDQRKAKHYQAWQAISGAQGKPGSGGRRTALEDLHKDGIPLVGVDLSGRAYLNGLRLPGADLTQSNLQGAELTLANLQGANLAVANLQDAHLRGANLRRAVLRGVNLQKAYLAEAKLQAASLVGASLQEAYLGKAKLREATLWFAELQGASLNGADLQGANLEEANIEGADVREADLSTARALTREQILSAKDWRGTKLPSDLKDLELPEDSPEEELDRMGRTWKPEKEPE